jgi:hypothetical protein
MKRLAAAVACAAALVLSGSAAGAFGAVPEPGSAAFDPARSLESTVAAFLAPLGLGVGPEAPSDASPPGSGSPGTTPGAVTGEVVPAAVTQAQPDPFPNLAPIAYAGYGTGTAFTSDAELTGVGVAVEKAFSASVYGSDAVTARTDEFGRSVSPALAAGHGFATASGAEIGTGEDRQELGDDVTATSPPNGKLVEGEVADVRLLPVLHADLLQTKAAARSAGDGCVIGSDLGYASGAALRSDVPGEEHDAERPVFTFSDDDPPRAVTQSLSRTGLVPPASARTARFGIFSETRQTIAPVTFFKGTEQEITVEVAGEWILRVATDGMQGAVSYGPNVNDPETPVLRIDRKNGPDTLLTAQDIAEKDGTDVSTPGIEEFVVGEAPRVIGGKKGTAPLASATRLSAAVDVVRISIPDEREADGFVEVLIGHMEAAVAAPAGGIACPGIAMAKVSDPGQVRPGERFQWTITVANPNDCLLDNVTVSDTITTSPGIDYRVVKATPSPASSDRGRLTFRGFRPLRMGESFTARIQVELEPDAPPGSFTNEAATTGSCGHSSVGGESTGGTGVGQGAPVPREGSVKLEAPRVTRADVVTLPTPVGSGAPLPGARVAASGERVSRARAVAPGSLARTGGWYGFAPGLSLLAVGVAARRLRRMI